MTDVSKVDLANRLVPILKDCKATVPTALEQLNADSPNGVADKTRVALSQNSANAVRTIEDLLKDSGARAVFENAGLVDRAPASTAPASTAPASTAPASTAPASTAPTGDTEETDDKTKPGGGNVEPPVTGGGDDNSGSGWGKWGTLTLGVVGALAWIGSFFASEEGSKGKSIFAGIGALLVGGALSFQFPDALAWLFGKSEATAPATDPKKKPEGGDAAGAETPEAPVAPAKTEEDK